MADPIPFVPNLPTALSLLHGAARAVQRRDAPHDEPAVRVGPPAERPARQAPTAPDHPPPIDDDTKEDIPMRRFTLAIAVVLCVSLWSTAIHAATFTVNSTLDEPDANLADVLCASASGFCTLRAAVQEANDTPGPDTIAMPSGSFDITIAGTGEEAAATGDLDTYDNLVIEGSTTGATRISGSLLDRVFDVRGVLDLRNVTVWNGDQVADGGGVRVALGGLFLRDTRVVANHAGVGGTGRGGGIFVAPLGVLFAERSSIELNTCDGGSCYGGGLQSEGNSTVVDVTVFDNSADAGGGGIWVQDGLTTLRSTTIARNDAPTGGGLVNDHPSNLVSVSHSIIADNTATLAPDCIGEISSAGYNLIENASLCSVVGNATGIQTGVDPALQDPATGENGTYVLALGAASPAVDAGNPDPDACSDYDQRGYPRAFAGVCDLGAHERGSCPSRPLATCRLASLPKKSSVSLRLDAGAPEKSKLKWKWRGDDTHAGGNTDYGFCLYTSDAVGSLISESRIPGGGTCGTKPCWTEKETSVTYKNKAATPDGITQLKGKAGTLGKGGMSVQGKGALLSVLAAPPYAALRAQLHQEGDCWDSSFTTPSKNEAGVFQAKN